MATVQVNVPRLEDEIDQAWAAYVADPDRDDVLQRQVFEAGFRAARTFNVMEA